MCWGRRARSSEIAFLLLAFHRRRAVLVDDAAAPLGIAAVERLLDDVLDARGGAFDRAAERIAAERAKAHAAQLRLLAGLERQPFVVDHDQGFAARHDRPRGGEVE